MPLFSRDSDPLTFPDVRGTRLTGDEVSFPADLPSRFTLIVVGFRDHLDPVADQWVRLGNRLAASHEVDLSVIETPVVSRGMSLFGSLATAGIRGQVDTAEERQRTYPIYVDKKAFRKELRLPTEGDVYALLVERGSGAVLWTGRGAIDMGEVEELDAALTEAASRPEPPPTPEPSDDEARGDEARGDEAREP